MIAGRITMHQLRDSCTRRKLAAHAILDGVRAGLDHPSAVVAWALRVLGEKA